VEVLLENLSKAELVALIREQKTAASTTKEKAENIEKKAKQLEEENAWLRYQVEQLKRFAFGQKRERFEKAPDNLPQLPFEIAPEVKKQIEEETTEKITYERTRKKHPGRQPLPDHLPVEEIEIYPEEDITDKVCIGKEVTDELEYQPARYYIKRYIRYKYASKNKEGVVIGKLPSRVIDKCIAGPGLLASILVDKYMDHLPLYRQKQRFKRENIPIASSTLEGWTRQSLKILDILYQQLKKETKSKGYLQADETPIKVQDRDKKSKCHRGYYWVYHSPVDKTVLFNYQPGRSAKAASHILDGFKGYLQTDGYDVYEGIGKREGVTHLFCWAHARREFEKVLSNDQSRAEIALTFIQALYKVETKAREEGMDAEQRKALRLDKSLPILNAFAKWMKGELDKNNILPRSQMGKAIRYSLTRWEGLSAYLYDGVLEIDNNLIENAIRPVALGRKNYLFAGSHDAAARAACIYSFFAICKKSGVNPAEWLKYVFENIMETKVTELYKLYPQNFKENKTF
jgi:transposase